MTSHGLFELIGRSDSFMSLKKLTKPNHPRYCSIGLYDGGRPLQPEPRPREQLYMTLSPNQLSSSPNPAVTEFEDFKYFRTASVRPRT